MAERLDALKNGNWLAFLSNKQPKCPHCGSDFDIQANEAWHLYNEDDSHDVTCPSCDLDFQVNSIASWTFSTDEQDTDNG